MATYVRFEHGNKISNELGPYEHIQITYNGIYLPDDANTLLALLEDGLHWVTNSDGQQWSDVMIYCK